MSVKHSVVVILFLGLGGCATNKVPVVGAESDLTKLQGKWSGVFSSVETGRHGDIHFSLQSGADTAAGHVVMIPHTGHEVMAPIDEPYQSEIDERLLAQGLVIQFVKVGSDRVAGELAPYRDPDCGCELQTTFDGVIKGNVIEGTYRSIHIGGGRLVMGHWRVERGS